MTSHLKDVYSWTGFIICKLLYVFLAYKCMNPVGLEDYFFLTQGVESTITNGFIWHLHVGSSTTC